MEGLDVFSSNGKLQYKFFAAGITWTTGLTLPETPISGSNTTPTPCPLPNDDFPFHVFIRNLYIQCVFAFHFLCPKWAAARHTGSKSQKCQTVQTRYYIPRTIYYVLTKENKSGSSICFLQQSPSCPKKLYWQNISSLVPQACCRHPLEGSGFHNPAFGS